MIFNLLADSSSAADSVGGSNGFQYVFLAAMLVLIVVYFIFSGRQRKKQKAEYEKKMEGIVPGDVVTTIGMWVGEVVEILPDGNLVLKTGSGEHVGYVTINKQGIYTVSKKEEEPAEGLPTEPPTDIDGVFAGVDDNAQTEVADNEEVTDTEAQEASQASDSGEQAENGSESAEQADDFNAERSALLNGEPRE